MEGISGRKVEKQNCCQEWKCVNEDKERQLTGVVKMKGKLLRTAKKLKKMYWKIVKVCQRKWVKTKKNKALEKVRKVEKKNGQCECV